MSDQVKAYVPRAGETVRDSRRRLTGVYMDTQGGWVYLRPEGGGVEWAARPEHIAPLVDQGIDGEEGAV
ncbi:hypothetical protein [Streptomyces sp. CB03911]|uniref:hypothetical protein n=1 Tax=Streptomyces sp. CB03911 TaxID=1804758 RepID=UPI00093B34B1|nr:hypothetical protein [Streptomyces sp. CB03911]OKI14125.1 hypothetical protein A6A07_13245 [Streptomyces sp. CB03911]